MLNAMIAVNEAVYEDVAKTVSDGLKQGRADACISKDEGDFLERKGQQVPFLMDVWPWQELRPTEPQNSFMTGKELRLWIEETPECFRPMSGSHAQPCA